MPHQQLIIVESEAALILLGLALIVFLLLWSANTLLRHHARGTESQKSGGSASLDARPNYRKPDRCPSCHYDLRASKAVCLECGFLLKSIYMPISGLQPAGDDELRRRASPVAEEHDVPLDALLFVRGVTDYANVHRRLGTPGPIRASDLCTAARDYALDYFEDADGARDVLATWGIHRSENFGRLFYLMVDAQLIWANPDDSAQNFQNVFTLESLFNTNGHEIRPTTSSSART